MPSVRCREVCKKKMADWVHCNSCFIQPGPDRSFLLTNCGHIYCCECVGTSAREKCSVCGTKCSTIPLASQMRPDIEMYFTDPRELLRKYNKNLQQVVEFQHGHRLRLFKNLVNLKEEIKRLQQKYQGLESYCNKLEEEKKQNQYKHFNGHLTGRVASSQISNSSRIPNSNINSTVSPSTPIHALNRVSIRTPPVNGKLGPINTYPFTNNSGGSRGRLPSKPPSATGNMGNFVSPMNLSPSSSIKSVQLNSGKSSYSIPNTSFCTPPQCTATPNQYSGSGNSGWKNSAQVNSISPTNFPLRIPTSRPSFGLIRRATISPYSPQDSREN